MLEIETKIIDVDVRHARKMLLLNGALPLGKFFFRRYVFDLSNRNDEDSFIRVRTDGKETTMTYKFRKGEGLGNTREIETNVGDFDRAVAILSKLIKRRYYHEDKRESYLYKNVVVDINTWPGIPPFIEVEGRSVRQVRTVISELDIGGKEVGNIGAVSLYKLYGKDLHKTGDLRFGKAIADL